MKNKNKNIQVTSSVNQAHTKLPIKDKKTNTGCGKCSGCCVK